MKISADVFEAFLKCSTKCWLRAAGEPTSANTYAEWVRSQNESYRADAAKPLIADVPANECDVAPVAGNLKTAEWCLAVGVELSMPLVGRVPAHALPSVGDCLHAVERVPSAGRGKPAQFIPIRLIFTNKLTKDDRLLLAFDAFVLSEALGREIAV